MSNRPTVRWVTRGDASRAVSIPDAASSIRPSSDSRESDSFSRARCPLRSVFAVPPLLPFRRGTSCPGSLPSSRRYRRCPLAREDPNSRYVPSSGFPNLSTVSATFGFTGLLHPAATSRVHPFRGFSRPTAVPDSSSRHAPVSLSPARSPASRLPPACASTSRPCSVDRCVPSGRCLAFPSVAPLFGFPPPPGLLAHRGPGSPGSPLVTFPVAVFTRAET
jgi:hypothetical protein